MSVKLKQCPWCGCQALTIDDVESDYHDGDDGRYAEYYTYYVECECGVKGPPVDDDRASVPKQEAARLWNQRNADQ